MSMCPSESPGKSQWKFRGMCQVRVSDLCINDRVGMWVSVSKCISQCKEGYDRMTVSLSEGQSMWNQSLPLCDSYVYSCKLTVTV